MAQSSKTIQDLKEFKDPKTFILLFDRALYIERLIKTIEERLIQLIAIGVHSYFIDLIYVLYRSMFQKATWENGINKHITTDAYSYTPQDQILHTELLENVDWVLAHQDNLNASASGRRHVYDIMLDKNGVEYTVTYIGRPTLSRNVEPLILLMKTAILKAYKDKFGKDLPILLPYEPLQKRT